MLRLPCNQHTSSAKWSCETMYNLSKDYERFGLRGSIEDQMKTRFYFLTRRCESMLNQVIEHQSSDAERRVKDSKLTSSNSITILFCLLYSRSDKLYWLILIFELAKHCHIFFTAVQIKGYTFLILSVHPSETNIFVLRNY